MTSDPNDLTEPEVLLLIEALDGFIPHRGNDSWQSGPSFTPEQDELYHLFEAVREHLKSHDDLGFYDQARTWLPKVLHAERVALTEALLGRLTAVLAEPKPSRATVRAGLVKAMQELSEVQFHVTRMPTRTPPRHV